MILNLKFLYILVWSLHLVSSHDETCFLYSIPEPLSENYNMFIRNIWYQNFSRLILRLYCFNLLWVIVYYMFVDLNSGAHISKKIWGVSHVLEMTFVVSVYNKWVQAGFLKATGSYKACALLFKWWKTFLTVSKKEIINITILVVKEFFTKTQLVTLIANYT